MLILNEAHVERGEVRKCVCVWRGERLACYHCLCPTLESMRRVARFGRGKVEEKLVERTMGSLHVVSARPMETVTLELALLGGEAQ